MKRRQPLRLTHLPLRAGVGLKPQHFQHVLECRPDVGFFEVHAENYMVEGGPMHHYLGRIREHYSISLHRVGLSLGGEAPPDDLHRERLARLIDRYEPASFSEHLAWSTHGEIFLNDPLPVAYDRETLGRVCEHVERVQDRLGRRPLLENPSTYIERRHSTMDEAEFMRQVLRRIGCGLLLDLSNLHISCANHGRKPEATLSAMPIGSVWEIHLAGYSVDEIQPRDPILIDTHGSPVAESVWRRFESVIEHCGRLPTLFERDNDVPPFPLLQAEAERAEAIIGASSLRSAAARERRVA